MKRKIAYVLALLLLLSIPIAGSADNVDKAVSKSVVVYSLHIDELGLHESRNITAVTLRATLVVYREIKDNNRPIGYSYLGYSLVNGTCGVANSFTGSCYSFKGTLNPRDLYCVAKWQDVGGRYNSSVFVPTINSNNYALWNTPVSFSNESYQVTKTIN